MPFSELRYLVPFTRYAKFYCSTLYADLLETTLFPVTNVDSAFYHTMTSRNVKQNGVRISSPYRMDLKFFGFSCSRCSYNQRRKAKVSEGISEQLVIPNTNQ